MPREQASDISRKNGSIEPKMIETADLPIKIRLILKTNQDPKSSQNSWLNRATNTKVTKLSSIKLIFILTLISIPSVASAGVFSFLSDLFSPSSIYEVEKNNENVQNMALLRAALNSDPNPSKGGGDILIINDVALLAESGPSGTIPSENENSSGQISIYVVREGDNLSQIASMFDVSVNTIIWANNIKKGSLISVGQTLVILPITGIKHTVTKGETIKSIVEKYKGNVNEVLGYNDLSLNSKLAIGDTLIIPDGEIAMPKTSSTRTYTAKRNIGGPSYPGYYIKPVDGIKTQGLHGYNGIDIGAPSGTMIVASASGQVIISRDYGWNGGYGNYIVIKHDNGTQTLYAHNSKNIVYVGQYVVQGQVIGYVGSTGRSTGPHIHFEVRGATNPF